MGVNSVTAGDASIVIGGTATDPTVETGTLDVIATLHPPAGNWSNNSHKITSLANGSAAQDAAAYGQTLAGGAILTTKGDLLYENATPAPARLPIGSAGQVLTTSTGGLPAWGKAPVDWVNAVTVYGADPTGAADSTSAIQSALLSFGTLSSWTQGQGGTVYLPEGSYLISKPLIIPSGVTLRGGGVYATVIRLVNGSNCDVIQWEEYNSSAQASQLGVSAGSLLNAFYASVQDLTIHGDAFGTTVAGYHHGINITTNPTNTAAGSDPDFDPLPLIANVLIEACTGDGFYHSGRSGALLFRVTSEYNNGNGFTPSFDTTIVNALANSNGVAGLYMNHGSDIGTGCKSYNNGGQSTFPNANGQSAPWISGGSYSPGYTVTSAGTLYFCILATSGTTAPGSDPTHWTALSATSPQAFGVGFYWDSNAAEHAWSACDSQESTTWGYYLKSCLSVNVQGTCILVNFGHATNPSGYSVVAFDGCTGCRADLTSSSQSATAGNICFTTNSANVQSNTLIGNSDGTESAVYTGTGTPQVAIWNALAQVGGFGAHLKHITSNYTASTTTDFAITADCTSGLITLTLPSGASSGQMYYAKKTDSSANQISLTPASGTIDGQALISLSRQYDWALVIYDGTNWWTISTDRYDVTTLEALNIRSLGYVLGSDNTLDDGSGNATFAGQVKLAVGTTSLTPLLFQSGTNLTSATAGAVEYDGVSAYFTNETTSGRGRIPVEQSFRLTATGGTISTIANYFGATSNISLVANAEYEIEIDCWFLKTTAGTVTWTFTNSAAPTSMTIDYQLSPATGIVTTAAATDLFGQQYNVTATAPTVVSASLTSAVNHRHKFAIRLINGTGTSLKIQATASAGSITPGINSYWKARRVPLANVGTFAA